METIPFDTFKQSEIRVGILRGIEPVPGSDKLLRCMVELGDDIATMQYIDNTGVAYNVRQILSGIKAYFPDYTESLVGSYALYIVNLEPRMIMGFESQGMLMAVGDNDCVMLRPHKSVVAGSKIH